MQLQNCVVIKLISVRHDFSFSPFYHFTSFSSFSFFWLFYERSVNCSVRLVLYWCLDIRPCYLCVFHNLNHVAFILSRSFYWFISSNRIKSMYDMDWSSYSCFVNLLCCSWVAIDQMYRILEVRKLGFRYFYFIRDDYDNAGQQWIPFVSLPIFFHKVFNRNVWPSQVFIVIYYIKMKFYSFFHSFLLFKLSRRSVFIFLNLYQVPVVFNNAFFRA